MIGATYRTFNVPESLLKVTLELGRPFASGSISLYTICTLSQHSTTFYLSWCVLVNFRTRTFFYYLPSPKYFALLNVRSIIVDASQPLISPVVKDNDDLAARGSAVLVRMCGVAPPVPLVNPILDAIFDAIQ